MGVYHDHIFPLLLDWATRPLATDRAELLGGARGRVLELGVGTGANFPFYTPTATAIHGLEPEPALLRRARQQAARGPAPHRFRLVAGDARQLPYPDGHFDTVVACLVLCTIPEPERAAAEIRRVIADHGQLLILEHVAGGDARRRRWQRRLNPLWRRLACGCHLTRPTGEILTGAGFDLTDTRIIVHRKLPWPMAELLEGRARPLPRAAAKRHTPR